MNIVPGTFYYQPKEKSVEKLQEEADLQDEMERIYLEFPWYGYRKMTKKLHHRSSTSGHVRHSDQGFSNLFI